MDVDAVLKEIGEFGPFQRRNYVIMSCAWIPGAFATLLSVFTQQEPDWHCVRQCVDGDGPGCTMGFVDNCNATFADWKSSREADMFCSLPRSAYAFDAPTSQRVNLDFGLTCDTSWVNSITTSMFFLGYFFGCGIFGYLADRWGRRRTLPIPGLIFFACTVATAVVDSAALFVILRFLTGIGVGGFGLVAYVLGNEFIGPSYRSATGTNASAFFSVGEIALAGVAFLLRGWRALYLVTAASVVPFLFYPLFVTETPRWLIAVGKKDEAKKVLHRIARSNGKAMPMDKMDAFDEERTESASYSAGASPVMDDKVWAPDGPSGGDDEPVDDAAVNKVSLRDIFAHRELRKRTLLMMAIWFANSFGYYGLSLDTANLGGSAYVNLAISSVAEIPALPLASFLLTKVGRKPATAGLMIFSGACCALGVFLPRTASWHVLRVVAFSAGKFAVAGSFGALYVYSSEVFPTSVRSAAMGMSSQAARVAGIVAPYAVYLSRLVQGLSFVLFAAVLIVCGCAALLLPETRGTPLMDTIADMDVNDERLLRASGASDMRSTPTPRADHDDHSALLRSEHNSRA